MSCAFDGMWVKQYKPVICLMGPTAAGKTALGLSLAEDYGLDIISVDSVMVYRGMDLGAAKPCAEELKRVRHHLIDIREPQVIYSAGDFYDDAVVLIDKAHEQGQCALLVGGTMMYFHALQSGLAALPSADDAVRKDILHRAKNKGWPALWKELNAVDSSCAARIEPSDSQRIQRALEVYQSTGNTLSSLQQQKQALPYHWINIGLFPDDRAVLHRRIHKRLDRMLEQGFIQEVEQLLETLGGARDLPALRAVGYRQIITYLQQGGSKEDLLASMQAATRQLAKRQLTWLRRWPNLYQIHQQNLINQVSACKKILTQEKEKNEGNNSV